MNALLIGLFVFLSAFGVLALGALALFAAEECKAKERSDLDWWNADY